MTSSTGVVAYLDPALLENVKTLALRRNDSKAPVASLLSGDATDKDLTALGETVPSFVHL